MLMIPDYISFLQKYEQREKDIETQFPGALEALIHNSKMSSTLMPASTNAEKVVYLLERDMVVIMPGIGTGNDILHATNSFSDELVWDETNDMWWDSQDDPTEYEKVVATSGKDMSVAKQPVEKTCPDCDGEGKWLGLTDWNKCKTCNGTGKVKA